jgi:hypothetical protein
MLASPPQSELIDLLQVVNSDQEMVLMASDSETVQTEVEGTLHSLKNRETCTITKIGRENANY